MPFLRTLNVLANYIGYPTYAGFCENNADLPEDMLIIGEMKIGMGM